MKSMLSGAIQVLLRRTRGLREALLRIYGHAHLASQMKTKLPASVIVVGRIDVIGTGEIEIGEGCFLFPDLYLETQGEARLVVGDRVVMSRGVHLAARAGITIGTGTMIGEYASVRDANHLRTADRPMRDSGFVARAIRIGNEVWIGRGVTILPGVTIGDGATVGANAVVTRDVAAGTVVAGVPAKEIVRR
jgi:acetyltransferase-like isoleucine patch superfamily enzyme